MEKIPNKVKKNSIRGGGGIGSRTQSERDTKPLGKLFERKIGGRG